jgi:hypothetical protein
VAKGNKMTQHHVWCNSTKEDATDCRYCACLYERFPQLEGETEEQLVKKYFPNAEITNSKDGTGDDWHRLSGSFNPDNCQICSDDRDGIDGNENIVGGVIMCDYCSADDSSKKHI